MDSLNKTRGIGRREEDSIIRKQNERFSQLCEVGKIITAEIDLKVLFPLVMDQTNIIMGIQRSSVFLHDEEKNELWSLVATGMEEFEIRIPSNSGIAGWVFQQQQSLLINDTYGDRRFDVGVDCKSGFKTENILCVPLVNCKGFCIGVLQALNSKNGKFVQTDNTFLSAISDYVAIALDNARLYNDSKKHSQDLEEQIAINESLVKLKNQLTKFVPRSVVRLAEKNPDKLSGEKLLMDVSVLFVDLQNFSSITENYDPRMVNHMIENHFSNYLRCVYNHSGELNETSGDGIMVIFKEDTSENSALKAVLTALDIIQENKRINEEFNYPWGENELHIGINSGNAYVGTTRMKNTKGERWTYTASGLVTVLASRIGSLSKESKLYIGDKTHQLIHGKVECISVGKFKFKNISEETSIHHVIKIISPDSV